jgi:hypothetical protein
MRKVNFCRGNDFQIIEIKAWLFVIDRPPTLPLFIKEVSEAQPCSQRSTNTPTMLPTAHEDGARTTTVSTPSYDEGNDNANTHEVDHKSNPHLEKIGFVDAIERRYRGEGWTTEDLYAAFLQASLLSYQSAQISAEERLRSHWNQIWNQDGRRDIKSAPTDYAHNCPWNDWTPPSESHRLFQAAQANRRPEPIEQRVRVRACISPDSQECKLSIEKLLVAFASVEVDASSARALVLRRGSDILAHIPVASIRFSQDPAQHRITCLSTVVPSSVFVCLYLEDARRVDAFLALF